MKTWIEIEVEVDYTHFPEEKQSFDSPGWPSETEITSVKLGDLEIVDLLDERTIMDIAKIAEEDWQSEREAAEEAAAESRYEARMEARAEAFNARLP